MLFYYKTIILYYYQCAPESGSEAAGGAGEAAGWDGRQKRALSNQIFQSNTGAKPGHPLTNTGAIDGSVQRDSRSWVS